MFHCHLRSVQPKFLLVHGLQRLSVAMGHAVQVWQYANKCLTIEQVITCERQIVQYVSIAPLIIRPYPIVLRGKVTEHAASLS
jgi:hypothetical protein